MELLKGRYTLEWPLGAGGMGEVFLGRTVGHEGFARRVAIKRILAVYGNTPRFRAAFTREAQLCSQLAHTNVVSVLDFDEDESGRLFLVMEYVDGVNLRELLATGPLPLPAALHVTGDVLRGLGHAHELSAPGLGLVRGLVHCDVTPHNVLLAWDGVAKVGDFGVAKVRHATMASASANVRGKPPYMSPEHANGLPVDGRSDLFSVGAILWEMLCGASLFGRETPLETVKSLFFDPIPSPRTKQPDVPADVEAVVMRLLERQPEARYASAHAALAALAACQTWPKNGREALAGLLAERFPARHSSARHEVRSALAAMQTTAIDMNAPDIRAARMHGKPTVTANVAPAPLAAMRLTDAAMLLRPRRRGRLVAAIAAALAIAGGAVWLGTRAHTAPTRSATAPASAATPAIPTASPAPASAATPAIPTASPAPASAATPAIPASPDRASTAPPAAPPSSGPGELVPARPAQGRAAAQRPAVRSSAPRPATRGGGRHRLEEVPLAPDKARWTGGELRLSPAQPGVK